MSIEAKIFAFKQFSDIVIEYVCILILSVVQGLLTNLVLTESALR